MAAAVVWCNKCKTAVWAYDQMSDGEDVRGLMNMMGIPCPECGEVANFDGWNSRSQELEDIRQELSHCAKEPIYDWWSALRAIFQMNVKDGKWAISPDCSWFKRPNMSDNQYRGLMSYIQEGIETIEED